jgi:hypothetical protein
MELDRRAAELLFQVLTEREEKNSMAIASNESFSSWTKDLHRSPALRGHRGPPHLRREHHRVRQRLLPARPQQSPPTGHRSLLTTPGAILLSLGYH